MNTMDQFTIQDMADFKEKVGKSMEQLEDGDHTEKAMGAAAMLWLLRRKNDPGLTYEQTLAVPMSKLVAELKEIAPDLVSEDDDEADDEDPLAGNEPVIAAI